jgi:hypothetical protein
VQIAMVGYLVALKPLDAQIRSGQIPISAACAMAGAESVTRRSS